MSEKCREEVEFEAKKESWNEYVLPDGTVIKMKTVVIGIYKEIGRVDAEGNPVYVAKSQNIMHANPPRN